MYWMIDSNICNGILHASVRYARANNKLISWLYELTQLPSFIIEVDANYQYGCFMSQKMANNKSELVSSDECRQI